MTNCRSCFNDYLSTTFVFTTEHSLLLKYYSCIIWVGRDIQKICYNTRMTKEIIDKKKEMSKIAEKYGLSLVLLFGSQATGYAHKYSDIDIGYVCRRSIDYTENYAICLELMQIFKHKDIELVNIYNVSPSMKKQISETGIPLYEENPVIFDYFKMHALREYIDTKPLRVYRDYLVKDFIKTYA